MSLQRLKPALAAFVAVMTLGAPAASVAGAATAARVTICYNRTNGVVHYAPSGRCAPSQTAVVVGRGVAGLRGLRGLIGIHGTAGTDGANGANGAGGADGAVGAGGADGATDGTDGADGAVGATGPQGPTGPTGVNVLHRVVSAIGTHRRARHDHCQLLGGRGRNRWWILSSGATIVSVRFRTGLATAGA